MVLIQSHFSKIFKTNKSQLIKKINEIRKDYDVIFLENQHPLYLSHNDLTLVDVDQFLKKIVKGLGNLKDSKFSESRIRF